MANNIGCNSSGGNCRYDHNALMAGGVYPFVPSTSIAGKKIILVGTSPAYQIYEFMGGNGGNYQLIYSYNQDDVKVVTGGGGPDDEEGDDEGDTGKPPVFGPTGPVYTPLDASAIAQRNYTPFYPQSYMPADPNNAYPTMGLLSQPAFGGTDLYQPWSAKYGDNVAPKSLWDYQPPSGLDVAAGPKVTFQK
jgi:hypothetical protein